MEIGKEEFLNENHYIVAQQEYLEEFENNKNTNKILKYSKFIEMILKIILQL